MADTKISALTAVASATGTDEIPTNESGTTKKVTITQIATYLATLTQTLTNKTLTAANCLWDNVNTARQNTGVPFSNVVSKSANYTVLSTDAGVVFNVDCTSGNLTFTLPAASGLGNVVYTFKKIDSTANTLTIQRNGTPGTDTIDGASTLVISSPNQKRSIICDNSSAFIVLHPKAPTRSVFTSSGTWTKPQGCTRVFAEVLAAGGGGGSHPNGSGQGAGGGGAGGWSEKWILNPGATETVTVGTGGGGGVGATPTSGSNGGSSSFGSWCSATGGNGGVMSSGSRAGGSAGVGSSGDINLNGQMGYSGSTSEGGSNVIGSGGDAPFYGFGPQGVNGANGNNALDYGGGGSGTSDSTTTNVWNGGNGANGLVIVTEYYD